MPRPLLLRLFVFALGVGSTAAATPQVGKCADDSVGLDIAAYTAGTASTATCIPENAFTGYAGDIELTGDDCNSLKRIESTAFSDMTGKLTINCTLDKLTNVGKGAFRSASNLSTIVLSHALLLEEVDDDAFLYFRGMLQVSGAFPALARIGEEAFGGPQTGWASPRSTIVLSNLLLLEIIDDSAFAFFGGRITISGAFPALTRIGDEAFAYLNSQLSISIACASLEGNLTFGNDVFHRTDAGSDTTFQTPCGAPACTDSTAVLLAGGGQCSQPEVEQQYQGYLGTSVFTGECKTHCCATTTAATVDNCATECSSSGGLCYPPLTLAGSAAGETWTAANATKLDLKARLEQGKAFLFNDLPASPLFKLAGRGRGAHSNVVSTSDEFNATAVDTSQLRVIVRWAETKDASKTYDQYIGRSPPVPLESDPATILVSAETDAAAAAVPGGPFYAQERTGYMFAAPGKVGNYTAWILIEDPAGVKNANSTLHSLKHAEVWNQATVAVWKFEVFPKPPPFKVTGYSRGGAAGTSTDGARAKPTLSYITAKEPRLRCILGETYRIAPIVNLQTENGAEGKVQFTLQGAPPGVFVEADTGEILAAPTEPTDSVDNGPQMVNATLYAVDADGEKAPIETIFIAVQKRDTENPANGPNGQACAHGGQALDDPDRLVDGSFSCDCTGTLHEGQNCELGIDTEVPTNGPNAKACEHGGLQADRIKHDGNFTCDCTNTKYGGENCEIETVAAFSPTANVGSTVGGLVGGFVAFLVLVAAVYKWRVRQLSLRVFDFEQQLAVMTEAGELEAVLDGSGGPRIPREIKRSHVTPTQKVGSGAFGEIWKAVLNETSVGGVPGYLVAVKTSQDATGDGADEIRREALVMAQVVSHANVVALIGVVTSGVPLMIVLSLCENGSLLSCLKDKKFEGQTPGASGGGYSAPSSAVSLKIALEIANGMHHLVKANFVHRDLAARNVLVNSMLVCQIADFGLSRGIGPKSPDNEDAKEYYTSHGSSFPVRWTAPEAIETSKFSQATDVWSFGVVLLEVTSGGRRPYNDQNNKTVIQGVVGGHRAPRPQPGCTVAIYNEVMLKCWEENPKARPTFHDLIAIVEQQLQAVQAAAAEEAANASYDFPDGHTTDQGGAGASEDYLEPGVQVQVQVQVQTAWAPPLGEPEYEIEPPTTEPEYEIEPPTATVLLADGVDADGYQRPVAGDGNRGGAAAAPTAAASSGRVYTLANQGGASMAPLSI